MQKLEALAIVKTEEKPSTTATFIFELVPGRARRGVAIKLKKIGYESNNKQFYTS